MLKQKIFTAALLTFLVSFANFSSAFAESSASSALSLQSPTVPPILQQIELAKQLLQTAKLNYAISPVYKKNTKKLLRYQLTAKDIALAIQDPLTGQITVTLGMQTGKTMKFRDPAVNVKLKTFNGVNSKFTVSKPLGGQVLAIKYLITPTESGGREGIVNDLYEATYVPYSASFADPAVTKCGADYLDRIVDKVAKDLAHLPSNSVPGKMLTEAIPPSMIKALIYAEHTDTNSVLKGDLQSSIDQLNILFATNEGNTYKYSVSSAGARGIAQFMPGTYMGLVSRHPEAGLISDFEQGMNDHANSIKAMYLLLDDYAGTVRVKGSQGFAEGRVFEYGAASYNGGTTRVAKAVNVFGNDWNLDQAAKIAGIKADIASLKAEIKTTKNKVVKADLQNRLNTANNQLSSVESAQLRNETVNYLQKIYKVISYFNGQEL